LALTQIENHTHERFVTALRVGLQTQRFAKS